MDLSVICYILSLQVLLLVFIPWRPASFLYDRIKYYHRVVILILIILLSANVLVYHFWGNLLNYRALSYLKDPAQMLHSFTTWQIIVVLLILPSLIFLAWYIFKKICTSHFDKTSKISIVNRIVTVLLLVFFLITGIRGGWQMLPMNESLVSYSSNNFLNQAALNPAWHLISDIRMAGLTEVNPFNKMDKKVADSIVEELHRNEPDSFPQIIKELNPNIIMIILESHTADVVGSLGGEKNVSPNLDLLVSEGLLFSSIISSGTRTDQGIVSVLNGWPATPYHSIMRSSEKSKLLPSLPKDLHAKGYNTSFYYGGESNFSNMNVYLINQGFDKIQERKNFPSNTPHGKWGVYDEYLFDQQKQDLRNVSQPFFSVMMTISTHEPFDVPGNPRFPGNSEADRFRNSAAYTDACIGDYMRSVRNEFWYKNTLFVFVADHGHRLPLYHGELPPDSRRIPLLLYGDVLLPEFRGAKINTLGSHHDIPATLLAQLHCETSAYSWSRNLLSSGAKNFAYYQIESVVGWMEGEEYCVYLYPDEGLLIDSVKTRSNRDKLLQRGQAYVQKLYGEYLEY